LVLAASKVKQARYIEQYRFILESNNISAGLIDQIRDGGVKLAEVSLINRRAIVNALGASDTPKALTTGDLVRLIEKFDGESKPFAEKVSAITSDNPETDVNVDKAVLENHVAFNRLIYWYDLTRSDINNYIYAIMHVENRGYLLDTSKEYVRGEGLMQITKPVWEKTVAQLVKRGVLDKTLDYTTYVHDSEINILVGVSYLADVIHALRHRFELRETPSEEFMKMVAMAYFDGKIEKEDRYYRDGIVAGTDVSVNNPDAYTYAQNVYAVYTNIDRDAQGRMKSQDAIVHIRADAAKADLKAYVDQQMDSYETIEQFKENPAGQIAEITSQYENAVAVIGTVYAPRERVYFNDVEQDGPKAFLVY
ncbi:MAG: hypothetical protein AAB855_00785, partial [Patescibacteria group bacterium]